MKQPIVIYRGPSMLDGSPIVVLASTGSHNVKTGSMVQTWIMRADLHPSEASARKVDSAICGSCPRRHSLGGDCYVQIVHAPRSVWESWDRQGRPGENWADYGAIIPLQADALAHGLRLGSYGDPMAVPWQTWQDLIDALNPRKIVGYTHQWERWENDPWFTEEWAIAHVAWFRAHVMASADSIQEAATARDLGWRFFLAVPEAELLGDIEPNGRKILGAIQCPATRSENPLTCDRCGACNGAGTGASVFLVEHGVRSVAKGKRVAALAVVR
jgi:hypothetical protein